MAILLAKADLLRSVALKTDCWIGEIAAAEALAKQTDDAVAIATLLEAGEIGRDSIGEGEMDKLMRDFNLHAGEAEAVLLAKSRSAVCGTDDGRAIRCCKVLGVRFTSAVSLLVALAEAGEVESHSHRSASKCWSGSDGTIRVFSKMPRSASGQSVGMERKNEERTKRQVG